MPAGAEMRCAASSSRGCRAFARHDGGSAEASIIWTPSIVRSSGRSGPVHAEIGCDVVAGPDLSIVSQQGSKRMPSQCRLSSHLGNRGTVSIFAAVLVTILVAMAGLVTEFGDALLARVDTQRVAGLAA